MSVGFLNKRFLKIIIKLLYYQFEISKLQTEINSHNVLHDEFRNQLNITSARTKLVSKPKVYEFIRSI